MIRVLVGHQDPIDGRILELERLHPEENLLGRDATVDEKASMAIADVGAVSARSRGQHSDLEGTRKERGHERTDEERGGPLYPAARSKPYRWCVSVDIFTRRPRLKHGITQHRGAPTAKRA